ncbi:MAG: hypothetical protein K8L91_12325 [Anaerolineae bacterium]|nr:hypothetical protein [Anaerolineae bacterium]
MPSRLLSIPLLCIGLLTLILTACLMMARRERPRGEWLAFTNYSDSDLYLVKTDGTLRRVTTDIVYYPTNPVWVVTRRSLLYTTSGDMKQVGLADGRSSPFVDDLRSGFSSPIVSKSGYWVYYLKATPNAGTEVWRTARKHRNERLTFFYPDGGVVERYALSPNERWIVASVRNVQNPTLGREVWRVAIGGEAAAVMTGIYDVNSLAWSPDGQWILVIYLAPDGYHIGRMRHDGREVSTIYQFAQNDGPVKAEWSPDGRWVAYNAPCQPDLAFVGCLWVASTHDWQPRILYNFGNGQAIYRGYVGPPRWSPDSQALAFAQPDTQNRGLRSLYLIGLDGSKPTRLAQPILGDEFAWAPVVDAGHLDGWMLVMGLGMVVGAGWIIKKIL